MEKPKTFFLIDDDVDDIFLFREVLESIDPELKFLSAENGEIGLQMLKTSGDLPDIIFLDLNMPKMDGREVLKMVKSNEMYRKIPVIVFSTTKNQLEVRRCYDLGANTYIVKPVSYDTLVETIREICTYWFNTATLIDSR